MVFFNHQGQSSCEKIELGFVLDLKIHFTLSETNSKSSTQFGELEDDFPFGMAGFVGAFAVSFRVTNRL